MNLTSNSIKAVLGWGVLIAVIVFVMLVAGLIASPIALWAKLVLGAVVVLLIGAALGFLSLAAQAADPHREL